LEIEFLKILKIFYIIFIFIKKIFFSEEEYQPQNTSTISLNDENFDKFNENKRHRPKIDEAEIDRKMMEFIALKEQKQRQSVVDLNETYEVLPQFNGLF